MILLSDFIKNLVLTSLSKTNLAVYTGDINSSPIYTHIDKIIHYINLSLTHLHTKFLLLQKQCLIEVVVPHTEYVLDYMYADSNVNSTAPHRYIKDSRYNPYYPHLIKILFCTDQDGNNNTLNDNNDSNSVHIMSYNTLQVSHSGVSNVLSGSSNYINVVYQANHVPLTSLNLNTQNINIAPFLEECLKLYISYLYFSDELGQKNIQKSQEAYNNYIIKINELISSSMVQDYTYTNLKLEQKGYV
jgi:hypothetical protein